MRFSCILFTIYFCRCKSYRSRSKALPKGLFQAIPNYTPLRQAEMPQIRAVHRRRVSLYLDRDSHAGIGVCAGKYALEGKWLLESDCRMLDSGAALRKAPAGPDRDASNSGSDSQEGKHTPQLRQPCLPRAFFALAGHKRRFPILA